MVYLDYAQTTPMSYEALDIYNKIGSGINQKGVFYEEKKKFFY